MTRTADDYMKLPYHIVVWYDEDDAWWYAKVQEFLGCLADGESRQAALTELDGVMRLWLEVALDRNHSIPEPQSDERERRAS